MTVRHAVLSLQGTGQAEPAGRIGLGHVTRANQDYAGTGNRRGLFVENRATQLGEWGSVYGLAVGSRDPGKAAAEIVEPKQLVAPVLTAYDGYASVPTGYDPPTRRRAHKPNRPTGTVLRIVRQIDRTVFE